jgi:hypothetical protein
MVDAQRSFMVDAQRRRNDSSRAHNPTDLAHADLQLLQLLRLQAHTHDAQAAADAGSDLAIERSIRHRTDRLR